MKIKNCTWCFSNSFIFITKRKDGNDVVKCQNCGLFFLSEIPNNLEDYYNKEDYFGINNNKNEIGYIENYDLISPLYLYWQKEILELVATKLNKGSLLEIGCATGNLLEMLKIENVSFSNIKGIDLSEFAVRVCKEKGLNVEQSTIDAFNSDEKFDVIFSSETMEHVDDLKAYIDGVKKYLKENGTFIFYIPAIKEDLAVKNNQTYKPFTMNLEHLLFFTKTFLDTEFKKYFGCDVKIHEYTMSDDRYIVGVVSNNPKVVNSLNMVLDFVKQKTIDNRKLLDSSDLYNASIISAKFYNFSLSEQILKFIGDKISEKKKLFLSGVIKLHKGELFAAERFFNEAFDGEILNIFKIKILYTIKKELFEMTKKDLDKKDNLLLEKDNLLLEKDNLLLEKDNLLLEKDNEFIELKNSNIKLENELIESNKEIFLIKSSRFWKWRGLFFKWKNILSPSKLLYLLKKAIIIVRRDGFVTFLYKLRKFLFGRSMRLVKVGVQRKIIKRIQEKWPSDTPLVSIVTAFYNAGGTINETIQSVISQTFQDFEYIIIDDGSTDEASIDCFDKIDNTKILKIKEDNHGPAFARNNGINIAKGKYILCLDADDTIDPTYIEKAISILELNPQYDVIYSDLSLFGTEVGLFREPDFNPYYLFEENILICASVFKKEFWKKVGGYKGDIGLEDWEFWINIVENEGQPKHIPESLFNYRKSYSSRYIDDKKKMIENTRIIKKLHPNYNKKIATILKDRVTVKNKFENDDQFLNLSNSEKYLNNSDKKSILLLMPWLSFGGAETLVYNYCSEIKNDYNISIITGLQSENNWDFKFKEITNNIYHLPNLFEDEENYLDFILNYIETRKIEVIHIIHNSCFYDMLPEIKKKFPKIKIISTVFNTIANHFNNSIKYEKYIDIYTTDNTKVLNKYNQQSLKNNAKNMVIYNGIDCNNIFNPILFNRLLERKKMGIDDNDIAIYFIGRLSPEKNPDIFVKVAKKVLEKHTDVKFFIIGDGIMRNEIEKLIKRFNHKNLTYLGYQTDIPRYLSTADIFVLPSSAEGFPLSNIEAMSMGVCVIASDVGGVSDAIIDEENGFLIKPNSVDELVNKIEFILNKKSILNKISKNARRSVEEKFSIEILAEKYTNLYKNSNE